MGQYLILTFDLANANAADYKRAEEMLTDMGYSKTSPIKDLDLPNTTFMGRIGDTDLTASEIRDYILSEFKKINLKPTRFFGGILSDWALRSKN